MSPAASFEDEIAKLSDRLAANPTSRIFAPLADAYRRAGRLSEAIAVCRQGLNHHPDYLSGLVVLARSYHDTGDLDAAGDTFRRVLASDPHNVGAVRALAEIARSRGDDEEALRFGERALALEPGDEELRERLESLRAALARAEAAVYGEAEPEPGIPAAEELAEGAGFQEYLTGAKQRETGADHVEPSPAGDEIATATLADVYAEQGLLERALSIYRRLLAEDPGNARVREKIERLEQSLLEEGAPLAERAARPAPSSFVPGEIQITGEEVVVAGSVEMTLPAEGAGIAAVPMPEEVRRAERKPAPLPWAFLLEEEVDHDPEEVFAGRAASARGELSGAGYEADRPAGPASAPRVAEAPAAPSAIPDDDLKKFQEWLKSLR